MLPRWWSWVPAAWQAPFVRFGLNWFPAFRSTGGRVIHVAPDLKRLTVCLPLNRRTRNGAGTLFGGSLYAVTDPIYAVMLALHLGRDTVVWDKSGTIVYRRPGRSTLFADFVLSSAELDDIRAAVVATGEVERVFTTQLKDHSGRVHVEVAKTVYVAEKAFYRRKVAAANG